MMDSTVNKGRPWAGWTVANVREGVCLFAVLCGGVLIGASTAQDIWITVAVGAGAALIAGLVFAFLRLGTIFPLIWAYFIVSVVDPSKSPVHLGEFWLHDISSFRFFLPVIAGLFASLLLTGLVHMFRRSSHSLRLTVSTRLAILLLLFLTLYGVGNGLLRGTNPAFAFGDALYVAGYLLFLPLSIAIVDSSSWRKVASALGIAIAALCVEMLIVFWITFDEWSHLRRIFLRGGMFFQVGAIVGLSVLLARGEGVTSRRRLVFGALGLGSVAGLILSNTRGYFLGFGMSLLILTYLLPKGPRRRFLLRAPAVLIGLFLFGGVLEIPVGRYVIGEWGTADFYASLDVRREQLHLLLGRFQEAPLFGLGLGATVEDHYEEVIPGTQGEAWLGRLALSNVVESIVKNIRRPYIYELDHLVLLMKFGLLGVLGWVGFWSLVVVQGVRVSREMPYGYPRAVLNGYMAGLVGFFISGATNPLMSSVLVTSFVGLLLALINSAAVFSKRKEDECKLLRTHV